MSLTDPFALACGRVRLPCQFLTDARNKQTRLDKTFLSKIMGNCFLFMISKIELNIYSVITIFYILYMHMPGLISDLNRID